MADLAVITSASNVATVAALHAAADHGFITASARTRTATFADGQPTQGSSCALLLAAAWWGRRHRIPSAATTLLAPSPRRRTRLSCLLGRCHQSEDQWSFLRLQSLLSATLDRVDCHPTDGAECLPKSDACDGCDRTRKQRTSRQVGRLSTKHS